MLNHPRLLGPEAAVIPSESLDFECPWIQKWFLIYIVLLMDLNAGGSKSEWVMFEPEGLNLILLKFKIIYTTWNLCFMIIWKKVYKYLLNSLIIYEENFNFFINFNFDFLALYKMYFRSYFANRYIKLESFTNHLQHSRRFYIRHTTLAFDSNLYMLIQQSRSCCK